MEKFGWKQENNEFGGQTEQCASEPKSVLDNWGNRISGMRCRFCVFFVPKYSVCPIHANDSRGNLGRCRRNAPTMNGWPAVFESDWCGNHKLDENKVER